MTVLRETKLIIPLVLFFCAPMALADTASIPETMPTGIPEVLVGGFSVRGLGDQAIPTRTGADAAKCWHALTQ